MRPGSREIADIIDEEYDESRHEVMVQFFRDYTRSLNAMDKALVALYLEDVPYTEIAQVTGFSEINARTRISRIKAHIKTAGGRDMKTNDKTGRIGDAAINNEMTEKPDPEMLIELFRKFERKQAAKRRLVTVINIVLFILYTALASRQTGSTATGYFLCGLGFIMGAAYLYFRYRPLPASDYTLPIMVYLRKAEKQLRYFTTIDYLIIVPLLIIIGIGGGLILTGRLSNYTDKIGLLTGIWVIFFTGLCSFGFWAGRKNWIRDNSKIHDNVRETLKSIEEENRF